MSVEKAQGIGRSENSGSSVLSGIAGNVATGLASAGINQLLADSNRKKDYRVWEKMNNKTFAQSQQAQRQAVGNLLTGAREAGVNPLFALGQNYTPAAQQAQTGPHTSAPQVDLKSASVQDLLSAKMYGAQIENINAQTEALRQRTAKEAEEADLTDAEKGIRHRMSSYIQDTDFSIVNTFANENPKVWKAYIDRRFPDVEEAERDDWARQNLTSGMLNGLAEYRELALRERKAKAETFVQETILKDQAIVQAMAKAPLVQQNYLQSQTAEALAKVSQLKELTYQLKSYGRDKSKAESENAQKQGLKLVEEIKSIKQNIKESVERADYWDSESKKAIQQTISGYINSGLNIANSIVSRGKTPPSPPAAESSPSVVPIGDFSSFGFPH